METSHSGVSGMLVSYGNTFGILYSTIDNDGYHRFSIAHELGHFFVEGHLDYIPLVHGVHRSRYISQDRYEREADCFAAVLLMPEAPVIGR